MKEDSQETRVEQAADGKQPATVCLCRVICSVQLV